MIYILSCLSASFFSPLDSSHGVFLGCRILVPIFLDLACCADVILVQFVSMGPKVVVVACQLSRMFSLPCWFDIRLEVGNLLVGFLDARLRSLKLRSNLGIGMLLLFLISQWH
jgi:hypothetical protein